MPELDASQRDALQEALAAFEDPILAAGQLAGPCLGDIQWVDGAVQLRLRLGFPARDYAEDLKQRLGQALAPVVSAPLRLQVDWQVAAAPLPSRLKAVPGVRNIIAVASGKGGVGKSTVAANLALALAAEGARVGVLDADIYGPSQPRMLGAAGRPESPDGKTMLPIIAHGLQVMSIGNLVDEAQPTIWRGPMATQALMQLLGETRWEDLDYLVVDLPPGTGDIQLTLAQRIPVSGAVIVTTPQDIALLDARKGLRMFERVSVPVLGVVENMATFCCPNCGFESAVFGSGGGERLAGEGACRLLGSLPLSADIRTQADGGTPTVVAAPDSAEARRYREIALRAAAALAHGLPVDAGPTITESED